MTRTIPCPKGEVPTIQAQADALEKEFRDFSDWTERYEHIIELGQALDPLPEELRRPEFEVPGCQSQVWLVCERADDGRLCFHGHSDSLIVRGLLAVLIRLCDRQRPEDILAWDLAFLETIGLQQHLTPSRTNGFVAMWRKIQECAARAAGREP